MTPSRVSKKVCLLGEFAVGKTSLVRRFVYSVFDEAYLSTIGVTISHTAVTLTRAGQPCELSLVLWDLAGSNGFRANYLQGAAGAIVVCDLTRPETLDRVSYYADQLLQANPQACMVLAANKADLEMSLSTADVAAFADRLALPFVLTSAKTGTAVETLFTTLAELLVP